MAEGEDQITIIPPNIGLEYDRWDLFLIMLMREFGKDLSRHDAKIANDIMNMMYRELQKVQDNLMKNINIAASEAIKGNQALNEIKNMLSSGLLDNLQNVANALNGVNSGIQSRIDELNNTMSNNYLNLQDSVSRTATQINNIGTIIQDEISNTANGLKNDISNQISNSSNLISTNIGATANQIKDAVNQSNNSINTNLLNVYNGVNNSLVASKTSIEKAVAELATTTTAIPGQFKDALEWLWNEVRNWLESNVSIKQDDLLAQVSNLIAVQTNVSKKL